MEAEKLTASKFADKIGVKRSNISHLLNGRNQPSFAFIQKVLETFTNVNSRWLITGQGKMYEKPVAEEVSKQQSKDLFSETGKENPRKFIEKEHSAEEDAANKNVTATKKQDESEPDEKPRTGNDIEEKEIEIETEKDREIETKHRGAVDEDKKKRIAKVLIFYENDTFKEYNPAE